jgi:hypothetical protein
LVVRQSLNIRLILSDGAQNTCFQHDGGVNRYYGMKGTNVKHFRSIRSIILAALLLVVGQAMIMPLSASASASAPSITVPSTIEVPAGHVLLFTYHAKGVQTYECKNGQWAFRAPKAALLDTDNRRLAGIHYGGIDRGMTAGPWWESLHDGSRIRGGNAVSAPSPNPNSIPLLRLEVLEREGAGVFSPVKYIQRLNTMGGVGPTGACSVGEQRWVPYTTDYYFYGKA